MTEVITDRVPMEKWGKDHWSTLGYIETRCVDHKGVPALEHMRTDPDRHPGLVAYSYNMPTEKSPTRLKGDATKENHDDWDCADDMIAEGLLKWQGTGINPVFVLTKRGRQVAAKLRAHKVNGGNFAGFEVGRKEQGDE